MPLAAAGTLRDEIDRLIPEERMLALLLGGVALIAAILGVAGLNPAYRLLFGDGASCAKKDQKESCCATDGVSCG